MVSTPLPLSNLGILQSGKRGITLSTTTEQIAEKEISSTRMDSELNGLFQAEILFPYWKVITQPAEALCHDIRFALELLWDGLSNHKKSNGRSISRQGD